MLKKRHRRLRENMLRHAHALHFNADLLIYKTQTKIEYFGREHQDTAWIGNYGLCWHAFGIMFGMGIGWLWVGIGLTLGWFVSVYNHVRFYLNCLCSAITSPQRINRSALNFPELAKNMLVEKHVRNRSRLFELVEFIGCVDEFFHSCLADPKSNGTSATESDVLRFCE